MKRLLFPVLPVVLSSLAGSMACSGGPSFSSYEEHEAAYRSCLEAETAAAKASAAFAPATEAPKGPFTAALIVAEASQVVQAYRDSTVATMRASLEAQRSSKIAAIRCEHLRPSEEEQRNSSQDAGAAAPAPMAGGSAEGDSKGASQVSTTNNQVAGVDEADFVKNDTKYIYVANGSSFRVIEAWPADTAHEIANLEVPGQAKKLFVAGDRALVYSSVPRPPTSTSGSSSGPSYGGAPMPYGGGGGECTYGYDGCVPSDDGTATVLLIFDITNRAAPQLVRTIESSSSLIAARRIGNAVHTVLAQNGPSLPWDSYPPSLPANATEEEVDRAYAELARRNEASIQKAAVDGVLPKFRDDSGRDAAMTLFKSSMPDGAALTSVLSVDLGADPSFSVASVIGRSGFVYASASSLYISVRHQDTGSGWFEGRTEDELSTVHKFRIGDTALGTSYAGSGYVKGRVLNQFSMDEKDGHLRIATTTGILPDPGAHNTLSVMDDKGGYLDVVGQLDQIAKTESIRSVRFDGDKGYVVTFKKTDPLFVFDLSTPTAPKELGELKIPGFSTYMHLMDPTHLLTIGYDAEDHGNFAYFTGVLLQIFDVADPTNPQLTHKEVIGTRGSSSEALTNHLAFNYFAPKNLLALPMTVCEPNDPNDDSIWNTTMTFSGLMVFDATVANGFSLKGKVAHPSSSSGNGYDSVGCYNWWTNATSEVRRSIVMDDYVFSISDRRIKVNRLDALSVDVKEIGLN